MPRTLVSDPAKPSESDSDLNNKLHSAKLEAEPIVLLRDLVKPFVSTVTTESEPVRDLDIEMCSVKLEARAIEPLSDR